MTTNPDTSIRSWFAGKTHAELKAIDFQNRILIPDAIHTRGPAGEERAHRVLVEVPTEDMRGLARVDAIHHVRDHLRKKKIKVDTVEEARSAVGGEVFENLDTAAIVDRCCRELEPPYQQMFLLDTLVESFRPFSVLLQLYERIDLYAEMWNPNVGELSEAEFWGTVEAIARSQNLSPLGVMRGELHRVFFTRMGVELSRARKRSSSSTSSETSTPAS